MFLVCSLNCICTDKSSPIINIDKKSIPVSISFLIKVPAIFPPIFPSIKEAYNSISEFPIGL